MAPRYSNMLAWTIMCAEGPDLGLYVNAPKCGRFWPGHKGGIPSPHSLPPDSFVAFSVQDRESWSRIPILTEGVVVLGTPLSASGTDFVVSTLEANTLIPFFRNLDRLVSVLEGHPQIQLCLIRLSLGLPKVRHLLATIPPSMIQGSLMALDRKKRETMGVILDTIPSPFTATVWSLPPGMAGFGLGSAVIEAPPAFVATAFQTRKWRQLIHRESANVVRGLAEAYSMLQDALPPAPIDLGKTRFIEFPDVISVQTILQKPSPRSSFNTLSYSKQLSSLFEASNMRQRAVLLAGIVPGARTALTLTPSSVEKTLIPCDSFRRLAAYAAAVPIFDSTLKAPLICAACGILSDVWGDHVAGCSRNGGTSARHDALRDTNERQLKWAGFKVHHEPKGLVQGYLQRPADLLVRSFNRKGDAWIDHTVVGPFSQTYLAGSASVHAYALSKKESSKRDGADQACRDSGAVYFPFAATTVGGLGESARQVLKIIAKRSAAKFRIREAECYQAFMREVAASIHRGNNKNWELQAISSNPFPGGGRAKAQSFVRGGRWSDRRRSS